MVVARTDAMRARLMLGLVACLGAELGCASRSVPTRYPERSAASHEAHAAPALEVVRSLEREPHALHGAEGERAMELAHKRLGEDDVVRIALRNNRDLRARLASVGVARGELQQAGLLGNPSFEAELSPERETHIELRAEYDVMSFVLMPMHKRAARHDLDAMRLDVAGDVVELGYRVRTAFYALQASEQAFHNAEQGLEALSAGSEAARALLAAGNIAQLDASSQIAAFERARITVAKLELTVAEQREVLQRLLGFHGEATTWTLADGLAQVPEQPDLAEDLELRALKANLALQATREKLEAIARRTGIARTEGWLPRIDLDVHSLLGTPNSGGGDINTDNVRWGGGVSIDVPIFDRKQGTLHAREAEFDSELQRYQGIAIDVRSAAREISARVRSAHRRARQYQTVIVPAQKSVMQETQLQYNAMQIGIFQLLEARRAQLEVALDYADTLREYWSAKAQLTALLAGKIVAHEEPARGARMGSSTASQGGH